MIDSTLARRAGRIAFGVVLALGMLVLAVFAIRCGFRTMPIHAWQLLLGTWLAAFGAAALVRTLTDVAAPPRPTALDEDRHRVAAFVVPAVGLALIAPLTVHLLVVVLLQLDHAMTWHALRRALERFDDWAVLSLALTGPAHATFALLVGRRATQLARDQIPTSVEAIYVASTIAACVPGIVVLLPPVIVALTGLPLLPFLHGMRRVAERDRDPRRALPAAIARPARTAA